MCGKNPFARSLRFRLAQASAPLTPRDTGLQFQSREQAFQLAQRKLCDLLTKAHLIGLSGTGPGTLPEGGEVSQAYAPACICRTAPPPPTGQALKVTFTSLAATLSPVKTSPRDACYYKKPLFSAHVRSYRRELGICRRPRLC